MQSGSKADEEAGNNAKLHMIKNKRKEVCPIIKIKIN